MSVIKVSIKYLNNITAIILSQCVFNLHKTFLNLNLKKKRVTSLVKFIFQKTLNKRPMGHIDHLSYNKISNNYGVSNVCLIVS